MPWLWIGWFIYCLGVAPTWCFVYEALRPTRSRPYAWLMASMAALLWPVFLVQFRRWRSRRSWVDELEDELRGEAIP